MFVHTRWRAHMHARMHTHRQAKLDESSSPLKADLSEAKKQAPDAAAAKLTRTALRRTAPE